MWWLSRNMKPGRLGEAGRAYYFFVARNLPLLVLVSSFASVAIHLTCLLSMFGRCDHI